MVLLLAIAVAAYKPHKVEIIDATGVDAISDKNDTFTGGIDSNKTAGGHYVGTDGVTGDVLANFTASGNQSHYVEASNSKGEKQVVEINSQQRKAHVVSNSGNSVNADLGDGKHIEAVVLGAGKNGSSKTFSIDRVNDGKVVVHRPDGGKDFVVTALDGEKKNWGIEGGDHPALAKWSAANFLNKTPQEIGARYGENTVQGAGLGQIKDVKILTDEKTAGGKLTISDHFGLVDKDPLKEKKHEGAVLKADNVKITNCLSDGKQDVLSEKGFKIIDKSLSLEYPPYEYKNGHPVYAFPSCFLVKAILQVPAKVNLRNVAIQAVVYIYPLGNLQCDKANECNDLDTVQRPPGSCFYCNLCKNDTKVKSVIGISNVDTDVCETQKTQQIPIEFKVCPPENVTKEEKNNLFKNDLFKETAKGDVDIEAKVFQKKSGDESFKNLCANPLISQNNPELCSGKKKTLAWELEGCKRVRMSYSFGGELLKDLTNKFSEILGGHSNNKR